MNGEGLFSSLFFILGLFYLSNAIFSNGAAIVTDPRFLLFAVLAIAGALGFVDDLVWKEALLKKVLGYLHLLETPKK